MSPRFLRSIPRPPCTLFDVFMKFQSGICKEMLTTIPHIPSSLCGISLLRKELYCIVKRHSANNRFMVISVNAERVLFGYGLPVSRKQSRIRDATATKNIFAPSLLLEWPQLFLNSILLLFTLHQEFQNS